MIYSAYVQCGKMKTKCTQVKITYMLQICNIYVVQNDQKLHICRICNIYVTYTTYMYIALTKEKICIRGFRDLCEMTRKYIGLHICYIHM